MYKIEIDWGFRSPVLGVLNGEVRIGQIPMGMLDKETVTTFPVRKDQHTLGYSNSPSILHRTKPLIDLLVTAYYDGMLMSNYSWHWFQESHRHNSDVIVTLLD